jgi:hypothetical protein
MSARRLIEHLQPWLGLAAAAVGWGASHQVGSASIFDNCNRAEPVFMLVVCGLGLAVAVAGGFFSFDIWRRRDETPGRRFLGVTGALLAALTSFAIILQAISALIIPPCAA